jgi:hypothetical protein
MCTGALKQQKEDFEKQISTLDKSAAAMASGRSRLQQMQELQDARQREKEEYEGRIQELEEQVFLLLTNGKDFFNVNTVLFCLGRVFGTRSGGISRDQQTADGSAESHRGRRREGRQRQESHRKL